MTDDIDQPVPFLPTDTEELPLIGGQEPGRAVTVNTTAPTWVDLRTAETYYRREFTCIQPDPTTGQPRGWARNALVHEALAGDINAAVSALANWRVAEWIKGGRELPVEVRHEPPPNTNGGHPHG